MGTNPKAGQVRADAGTIAFYADITCPWAHLCSPHVFLADGTNVANPNDPSIYERLLKQAAEGGT